jgi:hypothetical protein
VFRIGLTFLIACGRLDFEPQNPSAATACGAGTIAQPTIALSGTTYTFSGFASTVPVPGVAVAVTDEADTALGSTTSDAAGHYELTLSLGGVARPLVIGLTSNSYMSSTFHTGVGVAGDLAQDVPQWAQGAMDTVYSVAGVTRDLGHGTVNIAVLGCDGVPLEGVVVTVDPPPERLEYIGTDSRPSQTLTSTVGPSGFVIALNTMSGLHRITATKAGLEFADQMLDTTTGQHVDLLTMHPSQ